MTDTVVRVDTVRVQAGAQANPELEDRVARLQIQVLERDVQLRELEEELGATRLELVRNLARLQTQASRAEAASAMAEAEIALGTLRRAPGGAALPELARAQALFTQSSTEFTSENYGGALYLATQTRTLVRGGQARLRGGAAAELRTGETLFAVPVPLRTTGRSNVRSGPGLTFDVAFTLDTGAQVVGQSYTSQWVRVVDAGGREGWIFNTLVTSG
ncbi:MAG: SH3 domain-containing protein [Gemmatimonadota bacterium]